MEVPELEKVLAALEPLDQAYQAMIKHGVNVAMYQVGLIFPPRGTIYLQGIHLQLAHEAREALLRLRPRKEDDASEQLELPFK